MLALPASLHAALFPRRTARHAKPSSAAPVLLAGGLTATLGVADATALGTAASAGGSVAQFERLASCESGGNWSINTGNGYYGGLQFNLGTWRGLGMGGYPHQASKAQQISAGQKLHSQRGWGPWPSCSRKLGLSGDGGYSGSGEATARPERASRTRRVAAPAPAARAFRTAPRAGLRTMTTPPGYRRMLTTADHDRYRYDVRVWQRRMAARGWKITADGKFGANSAAVAIAFAKEKRIAAPNGRVNRALWEASWTTPIT